MMSSPLSIAILISGRGSNMQKLVEKAQEIGVSVALIAANKHAGGIEWANENGLKTEIFSPKNYRGGRPEQEIAMAKAIQDTGADYIFLAGYMAILSKDFIDSFSNKIINIHPSLLPKYKGLDTHERALDAGEKQHGATVHLVTPELDDGPTILQAVIDIIPDDTEETLAERTLQQEHILYPAVLQALADDILTIKDGTVIWDKTALNTLYAAHPNLCMGD